MSAYSALSAAELLAAFNALTGQSVARFSSRAAGEARMAAAEAVAAENAAAAATVAEAVAQAHADFAQEGASSVLADEADDAAADEADLDHAAACEARKAAARVSGDWSRTCPGCGGCEDITYAGLEGTGAADRHFCHQCSTEWFPNTGRIYTAPVASASRSAAIAASWARPEVAAARAARSSVTVQRASGGPVEAFASVPAAFKKLGLPGGQMVAFRIKLKAAGTLSFGSFIFVNFPA